MDAAGRRRVALTAVAGTMLTVGLLRALPRPLPPTVDAAETCASPSLRTAAPMQPYHLACGVDGKPAPASMQLLTGGRIDINSADVRALSALPGIGERTARRIVNHRLEHGPFPDEDALRRVKGIGKKTLERLRPLIVAR